MSLLPVILNMVDDIYDSLDNSARGHLGGDIPLLFVPQTRGALRERYYPRNQHLTKWKPTADDFQVALNVKSFKPEEVSVKVKGREIIVEGKHEERQDDHGYVSRQFTRRYVLPEPFDPDTVATYLDGTGKMTIKALKPKPVEDEKKERVIPIERVPAEKPTVEAAAAAGQNGHVAEQKAA